MIPKLDFYVPGLYEVAELFTDSEYYEKYCSVSIIAAIVLFFVFMKYPLKTGRFYRAGCEKIGITIKDKLSLFIINFVPLLFYAYLISQFYFPAILSVPSVLYMSYSVYRSCIYPKLRRRYCPPWPLECVLYHLLCKIHLTAILAREITLSYIKLPALSIRSIIITILFIGFQIATFYYDKLLGKLRFQGERGYRLPTGNKMFDFVSCPNFFFELLSWITFVFYFEFDEGPIAFALWLLPNVFGRGESIHRWCKRFLKPYPQKRSAVLPFVNFGKIWEAIFTTLEYGGF